MDAIEVKVTAAPVDEDFRDAMVDVMWENLFLVFYQILVRHQVVKGPPGRSKGLHG